jgi:hypothetical protein
MSKYPVFDVEIQSERKENKIIDDYINFFNDFEKLMMEFIDEQTISRIKIRDIARSNKSEDEEPNFEIKDDQNKEDEDKEGGGEGGGEEGDELKDDEEV